MVPELAAIRYANWAHTANHRIVAVLQCCVLSGKIGTSWFNRVARLSYFRCFSGEPHKT